MRAIQRFGQQLQRLRTRRGLTQEQLAVTAGLLFRLWIVIAYDLYQDAHTASPTKED